MVVTLLGITVFLQPAIKVFVAVSIMALQSLRESYFAFSDSTIMEERLEQPSTTRTSIVFTLLGIFIEVRL